MELCNDGAGGGLGGMPNKQREAGRWLDVASWLLQSRDLLACKQIVERALDADPLVPGADELLVIANVLLAFRPGANERNPNWYAVLQLENQTSPPSLPAVQHAYRRLARLLQPERNPHPGADLARRVVSDAWAFLSDPEKKRVFDQELATGAASDDPRDFRPSSPCPSPPCPSKTFWTLCPGCFGAHEYDRAHQDLTLRCHCCGRAFQAAALPSAPPVVPGTDKYFCAWGISPMGYPGCPAFDISKGVPCFPVFPKHTQDSAGGGMVTSENGKRIFPVATREPSRPPPRKVLAHKPKNRVVPLLPARLPPQVTQDGVAPNTVDNCAYGDAGVSNSDEEDALGFDIDNISIDLDATAKELGMISPL